MQDLGLHQLKAALEAKPTQAELDHAKQAYGRYGAHRAYLLIHGNVRQHKAVLAGFKKLGARICHAHGCGEGKALYLGYDNWEGGIYAARGAAIARELALLGIGAHVDAAGD